MGKLIIAELAELTGFRIQNYIEKHYLNTEEQRRVALDTWQKINLHNVIYLANLRLFCNLNNGFHYLALFIHTSVHGRLNVVKVEDMCGNSL